MSRFTLKKHFYIRERAYCEFRIGEPIARAMDESLKTVLFFLFFFSIPRDEQFQREQMTSIQ